MEQTVNGAPRCDGFAPLRVKRVVRETADAVSSEIESSVAAAGDADVYICGPAAFMDTVETTCVDSQGPRRPRLSRAFRCCQYGGSGRHCHRGSDGSTSPSVRVIYE